MRFKAENEKQRHVRKKPSRKSIIVSGRVRQGGGSHRRASGHGKEIHTHMLC